jgi:hypothetical protein
MRAREELGLLALRCLPRPLSLSLLCVCRLLHSLALEVEGILPVEGSEGGEGTSRGLERRQGKEESSGV